jgi:glycerol-3-phosphate acyltransferase PlsX
MVEGKDIPLGKVDMAVTDGFTGNVALKMAEGIAMMLFHNLRAEIEATLPRKLAALVLRPAFRAVRAKLDYSEIGGAPLLGVNGAVILAHGRSDAKAIKNAIGVGKKTISDELVDALRTAIGAELATARNGRQPVRLENGTG